MSQEFPNPNNQRAETHSTQKKANYNASSSNLKKIKNNYYVTQSQIDNDPMMTNSLRKQGLKVTSYKTKLERAQAEVIQQTP